MHSLWKLHREVVVNHGKINGCASAEDLDKLRITLEAFNSNIGFAEATKKEMDLYQRILNCQE